MRGSGEHVGTLACWSLTTWYIWRSIQTTRLGLTPSRTLKHACVFASNLHPHQTALDGFFFFFLSRRWQKKGHHGSHTLSSWRLRCCLLLTSSPTHHHQFLKASKSPGCALTGGAGVAAYEAAQDQSRGRLFATLACRRERRNAGESARRFLLL